MERKTITIRGDRFDGIEGFYDEAYSVLTSGLDWTPAHNLDALNDILYGGFGVFAGKEAILLRWTHFAKSRDDLGREASIRYYESRAAGVTGNRACYFRNLADRLRAGQGETLIGSIVSMIREKEWIEFDPQ